MHTHTLIFIQDLAIIMLVAGLITVLCHRFKQPIVFGYIIAGMVLGPYTPPFSLITDQDTIKTLAELGVIFLMFSLGLEFNLQKLSKVGVPALIASLCEIILMMWIGYEIGRLFGWTRIDAIFLGAILSISSTTIIIKALEGLKLKKEKFAQLIFGVLIFEDIFAIVILALLSSMVATGSLNVAEVIITSTKLASFLVVSLLLGILLIPRLLEYIAKFKSNEMLLISVLGLCFGFCLLVVKLQYSVALGAFLIGAIIAESQQLRHIEHLINPIRDMFSAIFFVSVGILFNPHTVVTYFIPILVITIAVIIGKVITCSIGILISGRDAKTALRVGMGLSQIGEFSFIIASLGITLNVTSLFLYSIAVAVSVITTLTTPYLIKYSDTAAHYAAYLVPEKVSNLFDLYTRWLQNIRPEQDQNLAKAIKKSFIQIVINLLVVVAVFASISYFSKTQFGHWVTLTLNIYFQKTIFWTIALLISLPFLIATYNKIKALSMILAELSVNKNIDDKFTAKVRKTISEIIPAISIILMMVFVSVLSTGILPPIELLILALAIITIIIMVLFPWFTKLNARIQASLIESLKQKKNK